MDLAALLFNVLALIVIPLCLVCYAMQARGKFRYHLRIVGPPEALQPEHHGIDYAVWFEQLSAAGFVPLGTVQEGIRPDIPLTSGTQHVFAFPRQGTFAVLFRNSPISAVRLKLLSICDSVVAVNTHAYRTQASKNRFRYTQGWQTDQLEELLRAHHQLVDRLVEAGHQLLRSEDMDDYVGAYVALQRTSPGCLAEVRKTASMHLSAIVGLCLVGMLVGGLLGGGIGDVSLFAWWHLSAGALVGIGSYFLARLLMLVLA